jgi:hypothetical protein
VFLGCGFPNTSMNRIKQSLKAFKCASINLSREKEFVGVPLRALFHAQVSDVDIVAYWEDVGPGSVKTPAEVYMSLKERGHNIDYARIPLTRERFPKASDVDLIQNRMEG